MNLVPYFKVDLEGTVKFIRPAVSAKPKVSRTLLKQGEKAEVDTTNLENSYAKTCDVKKRNSTLCPFAMHSKSHLFIQEHETCF
jgi:hypothetical protein